MAGTGFSGGRNRKSATIHELQGTLRRDRHRGVEPVAPVGAVEKPTGLSRVAGAVWDSLAPVAIRMGTLTPADVWAFGTLCELQGTLDLAARQKDAESFSLFTARGMADVIRLEKQYATAIRPYYALFGLSASDRSRMGLPACEPAPSGKWA